MGLELIAAVVAGSSLGLGGGTGAGLGFLSGLGVIQALAPYALVGGAVVGGSFLLPLLQTKQHADNQVTVKQASPPRQRFYGQALLGGCYFFFISNGTTLTTGYALCEGPIEAIDYHLFSNIVSGDGDALIGRPDRWPWYDKVSYTAQLGETDQASNSGILATFPDYWTADHRLRGIANTAVTCILPNDPSKNFQKYFPSGAPTYLAQIRGAKIFDPRDGSQSQSDASTWKYSENAALCILDYLTNSRGMGIPFTRIYVASFIDMANLCDEAVPLAAGGTEPRYLLWGGYSFDEEPKDILQRMLKTCDGELYPIANGTIGLRGGRWTASSVTITPSMILGCEAKGGQDKLASFNQLRVRYTDRNNNFQQIEGDPWDDVAAQEASGEVLPQDFDIVMVPSYSQGQRLAKIFMAKSNSPWILTLTTNLAGLNALGERIVHVQHPDLGIDDDFFVNGFQIADDGTSCQMTLGLLTSAAYEWSTAEEGNSATPITPVDSDPTATPSPPGLSASSGTVTINWTNPASSNFASMQIYRGNSDFADATLIATVAGSPSGSGTTTDSPGTGTWSYWIAALNTSGVLSTEAGPSSISV